MTGVRGDRMAVHKPVASLLLVLVACLAAAHAETNAQKYQKVLKDYDKSEPPSKPTNVAVSFYVNDFEVLDKEQRLDVDMYLRLSWTDSRLAARGNVTVPPELVSEIWVPDLFFRNAQRTEAKGGLLTETMTVRTYESGKVWLAKSYKASFHCPMLFHKYPRDTQRCSMVINSYSSTMETLTLSHMKDLQAVSVDDSASSDTFILENYYSMDCSTNYTSGSYPCLMVDFVLSRDNVQAKLYLHTAFILLVIATYVSFLLGRKLPCVRLGYLLIVALFVCCTALGLSSTVSRPPANYMTRYDIWVGGCIFWHFVAVLEAVVVLFIHNKGRKVEESRGPHARKARILDLLFIFGYPTFFIIFLVFYFAL